MSKSKDEDVVEQLRQATREARECLKDFRAIIKEYDSRVNSWKEYVNSRVNKEIEEGLEKYQEVQRIANVEASAAVFAKFDKIYDLLTTGGDHRQPSIPVLAEEYAKRVNPEKKR